MGPWPPLECGHMFGYFIRCPRVYLQEQLLSWEQLDDYNNFYNTYVHMVYIQKLHVRSYSSVLKTIVNPIASVLQIKSTTQFPRIIVKEDAIVVAAHCTYMVGVSEICI